jgi:hypothetical protein
MYDALDQIARQEFGDIVVESKLFFRRADVPLKLRLLIRDGSMVDIWLNPTGSDYSYHWEQRSVRGQIHRHDNAPDHPEIATFPKHFHDGREENLQPSDISDQSETALRQFLEFIRLRLSSTP